MSHFDPPGAGTRPGAALPGQNDSFSGPRATSSFSSLGLLVKSQSGTKHNMWVLIFCPFYAMASDKSNWTVKQIGPRKIRALFVRDLKDGGADQNTRAHAQTLTKSTVTR